MFKILISGKGGQGVQLIAKIVSQIAFKNGYYITYIPNYGLEQRGGASLIWLKIAKKPIAYPKFDHADVLILLHPDIKKRVKDYYDKRTFLIDINKYQKTIVKEKWDLINNGLFDLKSLNMFALGFLTAYLEVNKILTKRQVESALKNKLKAKNGWRNNFSAFKNGYKIYKYIKK